MKNKLIVLLSLILCFSMIFMLASCGEEHVKDTDTDTETKTETESETNTETETETKVESETDTEVESETETEVESETNTEVESESDTEVESETETEVETETDTETVTDTETEVESETDTEVESETETEVDTETDTETETETEVDTETDTETATDTETVTDTETEVETDTETEVETDTETVTDTETEVESETDTETETETEVDTETDTETATDTETVTDTETEVETDTETEIETETETDTETEVETETDTETEIETDTETETECEHAEWEEKTIQELTCEQNGIVIKECNSCGEELDREELLAEGHKWSDWKETQELTCEQDGIREKQCTAQNCDAVETETTEAEGHIPGEWETLSELNCIEDGIKVQKCTVCKKELDGEVVSAAGHQWTEWGIGWDDEPFVKEATCQEAGYVGRVCYGFCGAEEVQTVPISDHQMSEWFIPEGVGCTTGGTVTRACTTCDTYTEQKELEPGEHIEVIYDGVIEATKEQDGSTGVKKCKICGATIEDAKVVRIVNVASNATVTSNASHWQVVGNNWAPNTLTYINDGNKETGMPSCANTRGTQWVKLTFEEAINLTELVVVCNGKGNIGGLGSVDELTNLGVDLAIAFIDSEGNIVSTETKNSLDVLELSFKNTRDTAIKEITISYQTEYNARTIYLWEVEAYEKQYLDHCEANGHTWSDWDEISATCSPEELIDGFRTRECTACGETDKETIVAAHQWTEWNTGDITCESGGTKTRECTFCGKEDVEIVEPSGHLDLQLVNAKAATFEEDGYTGDYVCKACGNTIEEGTTIPKIVNLASSATATTTAWVVTAGYINDGKMDTGATGYGDAVRNVTHTLTWASAVEFNTFKLYFNGDTTDRTLGSEIDKNFANQYNNTNANTTLTVKFYGTDGTTVVKEVAISTVNLTEYTISFEEITQISKVEIVNYQGWDINKAVNIWEVQAYTE